MIEAGTAAAKSRGLGGISSLLRSRKVAPYIFVSPFVVSFLLFLAYPIVSAIVMSFQEVLPGQTKFLGLANYANLFQDSHFYNALRNSARYTVFTLLILIPVPLVLAVFIHSKLLKMKTFFKSALFIPALTSVVVAGAVFRLMFGELPTAPMNTFLAALGFEPMRWTTGYHSAMFLMVLLASWRWMGINILYFLSGLQSIPKDLYESAAIDGASPFQRFVYVTVPMLKPVTVYVLTISIFGGFSMFTESYVFWGANSPADVGLTIVGYLYQQSFVNFRMGFGAAIGIVLLLIILIMNLIQLKLSGQFKKGDA